MISSNVYSGENGTKFACVRFGNVLLFNWNKPLSVVVLEFLLTAFTLYPLSACAKEKAKEKEQVVDFAELEEAECRKKLVDEDI